LIFYTLNGPTYQLEICEDKIKLVRRGVMKLFTRKPFVDSWDLQSLSHVEISEMTFMTTGKIFWKTFDGKEGSFRFTTNPQMMKKIEAYLQKRVLKNQQAKAA
jgi:hypothetical protein